MAALTAAADAQGNAIHEQDRVVALGCFGQVRHTVLGIEERHTYRGDKPVAFLKVDNRPTPILASVVVREEMYQPWVTSEP